MTVAELSQRNTKSNDLKVFQIQPNQYFVESSEGKICYRVLANNGSKVCTCGDYTSRIGKDPNFLCKHILAVVNGNGNIHQMESQQTRKPTLDGRWIIEIEGREFVKYPGLLDLGHQKGIAKILVDPLYCPTKENGMMAICKATVVSLDGKTFSDIGDANPENCSSKVRKHLLRMASTRAIARALRSYTNIGITCFEELAGIDDELDNDSGRSRDKRETKPKPAPPKEQPKGGAITDDQKTAKEPETSGKKADQKTSDPQAPQGQTKPSQAQIKAIEKLAERRGFNGEHLLKIFTDKFNKPYEDINSEEAKDFIKHLQQAA
jgi:hypothetical protein